MRKTGIVLVALTAVCLADAGVLDYVEPILGTPVVATSADYVTGVLTERGWSQIETNGERVTAVYVGNGRDENLAFTLTPTSTGPGETHQDILTVDYTYVPWLELPDAVERTKAEFHRLAEAFCYLIGPGAVEASTELWSHTWPGRDTSRVELILWPMYSTKLTARVNLVPLREPEDD